MRLTHSRVLGAKAGAQVELFGIDSLGGGRGTGVERSPAALGLKVSRRFPAGQDPFFQVIQSATLGKGFIASPRTEVHLGPEMRQIRQAARLLHPFLLFVDNSSPPSGSQNVAAGSG
jgi:hypothetical protein